MVSVSIGLQSVSIYFSSGTLLPLIPLSLLKVNLSLMCGQCVLSCAQKRKVQILSKENRSNTNIIPEAQSPTKGNFGSQHLGSWGFSWSNQELIYPEAWSLAWFCEFQILSTRRSVCQMASLFDGETNKKIKLQMRERFSVLTKFTCYINNCISDTENKENSPIDRFCHHSDLSWIL